MSSSDPSVPVEKILWTPALVETFWNGIARTRLDDLSFGKVAGPQFLDLVAQYLVRGGRHLDFGAGSGHVVKLLLDRGYNAAGFDPSPERQGLLTEAIGHHERFLGAEGARSPNRYDVVLMMEVIEHILEEDFESTLQTVSDFVRPGGVLIVSTPNNEDLEHASVFCPVSGTLFHPWQHVRSLTPASLSQTLERFGFRKEMLILADFSNDAKRVEDFKRYEATASRKAILIEKLAQSVEELSRAAEHPEHAAGSPGGAFLGRLLRQFSSRGKSSSPAASQQMPESPEAQLRAKAHAAAGLARELQTLDREPVPPPPAPDHEGVNCRIGRETTIVYVGRKTAGDDSKGQPPSVGQSGARRPHV